MMSPKLLYLVLRPAAAVVVDAVRVVRGVIVCCTIRVTAHILDIVLLLLLLLLLSVIVNRLYELRGWRKRLRALVLVIASMMNVASLTVVGGELMQVVGCL